jgi:hypothetical protein
MRRRKSQDRQAQLVQFYETLPPLQRGVVICVLLCNALLVVAVQGVVAVAIIRGAVHVWQHRRLGLAAAMRTGSRPALFGAIAAAAVQWMVVRWLMRAMDSGRAAAWLERSERWLTDSAGDQAG